MPSPPGPPLAESPKPSTSARETRSIVAEAKAFRVADLVSLALFLGLTFLLGVFPLNDTDFWWHLRTGDLIRRTGRIPHVDLYTFGASDHAWIDLHWGFQVALSWLHQLGGIDALNLAKCGITTLAVGLLITARRRDWPIWTMVLAWLPALLVLSGRMYVRPETVTLLYMAVDLAVLSRVDRHPRLIWVVPIVQVFWVNTQGLFVFGPIFHGAAVIDAALRPGAFAKDRHGWWKTVLSAGLATGFACLLNPYGIFGALFPLELAGTMTNPTFRQIQELQPLVDIAGRAGFGNGPSHPDFVARAGLRNLPLQLHFLALIVGGFSFLLPIVWRVRDRFTHPPVLEEPKRKAKRKKKAIEPAQPLWRLSPLRILLYAAFSVLSFRASRNSHQFAAVVGTITAWNFGEWGAAIAVRRDEAKKASHPLVPRVALMALLAAVIGLVASGKFYEWAGEGRTVGLGERPLWYPHEAVKFAGSAGMPDKFLVYHNGHAGLFEYHNGPKQKVFADARLEVMGPDVYEMDLELGNKIASQRPGWSERIQAMGSPVPGVLLDHVQVTMAPYAATLLGSSEWRCVWYDPIASVYLHRSVKNSAKTVDFAARHFGLDPDHEPRGRDARLASAVALRNHAYQLWQRGHFDRVAAMVPLGLGYLREVLAIDPSDAETWRIMGLLESLRDQPTARVKAPFDPIFDLSAVRSLYELSQADRLRPDDVKILTYLLINLLEHGLDEQALTASGRLLAMPITPDQARVIRPIAGRIAMIRARMNEKSSLKYENLSDLDRLAGRLLDEGRVETAANLLEKAYPPASRSWEMSDRLATLRLRLGQPDRARTLWQSAPNVPRPALRDARIAVTYLVEGDFDAARKLYQQAIAAEPKLFEALYELAALECDAGRAEEALTAAEAAKSAGSTDVAKSSASAIVDFVRPYAKVRKSTPATP